MEDIQWRTHTHTQLEKYGDLDASGDALEVLENSLNAFEHESLVFSIGTSTPKVRKLLAILKSIFSVPEGKAPPVVLVFCERRVTGSKSAPIRFLPLTGSSISLDGSL